MKRTWPFLLGLVLLAALAAQAQFSYTTNANNTLTITGYSGSAGGLSIPSTIDALPVTGIEEKAFYDNSSLTSVSLPGGITNIGDEAFEDCVRLTSIAVSAGNPAYTSVGGSLFDKGQTTLIQYPIGKAGTSFTIPNGVTSVGDGAFAGGRLTSITIPSSVTSIGDAAFFILGLTSITIPSGVTSIGAYAFEDDALLTSIYFEGNAPRYGIYAFETHSGGKTTAYYGPGTSGWGGSFPIPTSPWNPPSGSLQVTIMPAATVAAGAQWLVDDGPNEISGMTVTGLSVGVHTVSFTPISGWNTPADQTVTIKDGATTTASGVYKPLPPQGTVLILQTNGDGTLEHGVWPQELVIGAEYTVTAKPKPGNVFSNWVGGTAQPYSVLSASASYTFTMQSGLVLEANFVPNPFLPEQGTFSGLFLDTNEVTEASSGFFTLALTASGAFTGKVMTSGGTYSLPTTTPFDAGGQVEFTVPTKQNKLTFNLQLNIGDPANQQITGTVSDGTWTAGLTAERAVFSATTNKAVSYEGQYTLAIAGNEDAAASPGGFGWATLSVSPAGLITMAGNLADGTAMSQSVSVSKDGRWPFYAAYAAPPAGNGGAMFGWISFSNVRASGLAGTVHWFRPAGKTAAVYQGGFTSLAVPVTGSAYSPAGKPLLGLSNGQVTLDGGNLPFAITNQVILSSNGTITVAPPNTNKLALTISKTTGAISGSFANPSNPKQSIKISGVLLQNQSNAVGYFLGTNQSGAFVLENPR